MWGYAFTKHGAKRGVKSRMKYGAKRGVKSRMKYGVKHGVSYHSKRWGKIWGANY